jgi:Na+/melibiose symporter-like transporter
MMEPTATPSAPDDPLNPAPSQAKNPVLAHPVTSIAIGVLVAAAILCTLIVPIYASVTPKVGDFPFFYFYLLVYMPATAVVLWIAMLLQRRLSPRQPAGAGTAGTAGDPVPGGAR